MTSSLIIRFANQSKDDLFAIQAFLNQNWCQGHILVKSKILFDWQHLYNCEKRYNYAIAYDDNLKEIIGVLGFIQNSQYDSNLIYTDSLWLTTWIVKNNSSYKMVGIQLLNYIRLNVKHHFIGTIGCNSNSQMIYSKMGFEIGSMNRFFVLNPKVLNKEIYAKSPYNKKNKSLDLILGIHLNNDIETPYFYHKSFKYFCNKYLNHPFYIYKFWTVFKNYQTCGLLVGRVVEYKKNKFLRLVDYYGMKNDLLDLSGLIEAIIVNYNIEWADLYIGPTTSIDELNTDFKILNENLNFDLPTYFEPYIPHSSPLHYAFKCSEDIIFFKADGDQDRPNLL